MPADTLTVVDPNGTHHSVVPVRSKQHAVGFVYDGHLHPSEIPSVPANAIEAGKPVVREHNSDGQSMKRFLVHQDVSTSDMFRNAHGYACSGEDIDLIPEPEKGYVTALRNYGHLPPQVVCTNGKVMTRERWMLQGIVVTKPANMTDQQKEQMLAAAYWTRESRRHNFSDVLNYYRNSGHIAALKRPYSHRPNLS